MQWEALTAQTQGPSGQSHWSLSLTERYGQSEGTCWFHSRLFDAQLHDKLSKRVCNSKCRFNTIFRVTWVESKWNFVAHFWQCDLKKPGNGACTTSLQLQVFTLKMLFCQWSPGKTSMQYKSCGTLIMCNIIKKTKTKSSLQTMRHFKDSTTLLLCIKNTDDVAKLECQRTWLLGFM